MEDAPQIVLRGGRITPGVVRVGHTVRRPPSPNSEFVFRLLGHLSCRGFQGAPAALGTDEEGRDVFAFVEGEVPSDLSFHDDETLRKAASLIRRFHDLGAELLDTAVAQTAGLEVVCHNDLSPCNFVFRAGVPVAIIDFDACAPGSRIYDLSYAAWLWLDLGNAEVSSTEQARRLAVFVGAYGGVHRGELMAVMLRRQTILIAEGQRRGDVGMARWAQACRTWTRLHADALTAVGTSKASGR